MKMDKSIGFGYFRPDSPVVCSIAFAYDIRHCAIVFSEVQIRWARGLQTGDCSKGVILRTIFEEERAYWSTLNWGFSTTGDAGQ